MKKTVTITVDGDYSKLGDGATTETQERYEQELATLLSDEFGVRIHVVNGSCDGCSERADIDERIREILAGDEWMRLVE